MASIESYRIIIQTISKEEKDIIKKLNKFLILSKNIESKEEHKIPYFFLFS